MKLKHKLCSLLPAACLFFPFAIVQAEPVNVEKQIHPDTAEYIHSKYPEVANILIHIMSNLPAKKDISQDTLNELHEIARGSFDYTVRKSLDAHFQKMGQPTPEFRWEKGEIIFLTDNRKNDHKITVTPAQETDR